MTATIHVTVTRSMGSRRWLTVLAGTTLLASLFAAPTGAAVKRADQLRRAPAPKFVPER